MHFLWWFSGITSVTDFVGTCAGWVEFQPPNGTAQLRYDFGIRYPGRNIIIAPFKKIGFLNGISEAVVYRILLLS